MDFARRARREIQVLLAAVIVGNVTYSIVALLRGSNMIAWVGIVVASVIAHVTVWRLRSRLRIGVK